MDSQNIISSSLENEQNENELLDTDVIKIRKSELRDTLFELNYQNTLLKKQILVYENVAINLNNKLQVYEENLKI